MVHAESLLVLVLVRRVLPMSWTYWHGGGSSTFV